MTVPVRIRKIDKNGYHLFLKGSVNGSKVNLLLDTGASKSVFDHAYVAGLLENSSLVVNPEITMGIGADSVESHIATIPEFCVGDFAIKKFKTVLMDLNHVNRAFDMIGLPHVQGIVGGDILKKYNAQIDYPKKVLMLSR